MRRALALLLLVAACGFQPLYGEGEGAADALRHVQVAPIPERAGQILRTRLSDGFALSGPAQAPRYRLHVTLAESLSSVAIARDATARRGLMTLTASFRLEDIESGETLLAGQSRSMNAYNVLDSVFAGVVTVADARERGLTELAQDIRTRVALALRTDEP